MARFDAGKKELTLTLYQALVLLLFNEEDEMPFGRIAEATGLVSDATDSKPADATELRRVLQSLACGKKKVLRKTPPGKEVDDADVFRFNAEFTDPKYKVHISSILVHDTVSTPPFRLPRPRSSVHSPKSRARRRRRSRASGGISSMPRSCV